MTAIDSPATLSPGAAPELSTTTPPPPPLAGAAARGRNAWMASRFQAANHLLAGPLGLLFVLAVWAIARPYHGVRHDALLYAGQTIHRLYPDRLKDDLFFLYGSQDRFSVFSRLLGELVARFGLAGPELAALVVCQVLFVVAIWKLSGHFTRQTRWLSALCVTVFPHAYSSVNTFGFAENFLSARSLAEPLGLLALFAWARHRRALALALLGAASLVHPLMVLPLIVIGWIAAVRRDPRWLLAVLLAGPLLGLAAYGISPFDALLVRMDDAWWLEVRNATHQILMTSWDQYDWMSNVVDVCLLAIAASGSAHRLREWFVATLWAVPLLLGASFVGVDLAHNALMAQLQLWRVMWVAHVLALMCLPVALHVCWVRSGFGAVAAMATIDALLAVGSNFPHAALIFAWFLATIAINWRSVPVSTPVRRAALAASIAVAVLITLVTALTTFRQVSTVAEIASPWQALLSLPLLALASAFGAILAMRVLPRAAAWGAVVLLLGAGAVHWDQRSPWNRLVEGALTASPHPFDRFIGPHATVFWYEHLDGTWLLLQRSAFYAGGQGAGIVFHRQTAMEFRRHRVAMAPFDVQRNLCVLINQFTEGTQEELHECVPTPEVFKLTCTASPHPDFVVLQKKLPQGLVDEWTFAPAGSSKREHYYLYDCSRI